IEFARPSRRRLIVIFAEKQAERFLSGAAGLSHGAEIDLRLVDGAVPAGTIDLPFPGGRKTATVFHHDRKIWIIFHRCLGGSGRAPGCCPGVLSSPSFFLRVSGMSPSRCAFLRASLRVRRIASAFSRFLRSEGFS